MFQAVRGAASLGLLHNLAVRLLLNVRRLRPGQLCDVKHEADAQEELFENGPQLGDQVELHDLTQQVVVSGRVHLELWDETDGDPRVVKARKSDLYAGYLAQNSR